MRRDQTDPRPSLRPFAWAAGAIASAIAVQALLLVRGQAPLYPAVFDTADTIVLALAGAVLWRRAPTRTGPLLLVTGAALGLSNLVYVDGVAVLRTVGMLVLPLFIAPLSAALLTFPGARLRRTDRLVVLGALLLTTVLWWVVLLAHEPPADCVACPREDLLPSTGDRGLFELLAPVHGVLGAAVGVYVSVALVRRWRRSSRAARRVRAPVMTAGAATCTMVGLAAPFGYEVVDGIAAPPVVSIVWGIAFAAIPIAMLVALLRQRTSRVPMPELLRALERSGAPLAQRDALAAALGDPTLELVHRIPGRPGWYDGDGGAADLAGGGRIVTPLGGPSARRAMLHDVALLEDHMLLDTVARAAALALEHERVQAELRVQLAEARAVRARIVQASDASRQRIERDLHDGAQQTLVSLALALGMLGEELEEEADDLAVRLVRHASEQADHALAELRDLARGVFPALLVNDGLPPALRELARRCPLAVTVHIDVPTRPAPAIEAAAWFLVREGLANAVAHAEATQVWLRAELLDGHLDVEVVDDGRGGAHLRPGGGLAQLADRIAALGGTLAVQTHAQGGARLAARVPPAGPTPPGRPAATAPSAVPSG